MFDLFLEFVIYAIFPYFKRKKRRQEEWFGILQEKRIEGDFSLKKHKYVAVFKTNEGQKRKMKLTEELYHTYEEGKQYRKRSGEDYPKPLA
jgi:hypothetical protein